MSPSRLSRWSASALGVALLVSLASCSQAVAPAATVEGERITNAQLAGDMSLFRFLASLSQSACGQALSGETEDAACARFTLSNLIQEDLVKQYAGAHHVTVSQDRIDATLSQLDSSFGTAQLNSKLKAQGLTRVDLVAVLRRILLFDEVQRALAAGRLSDADLRTLYEQQKNSFAQIHARHILVTSKALADRIERQVTAKNFADLAKKYSTDTGSAANGGDLGTIPASQLDADFVAGALALQPGQISPPVHTQFGWHIIELVSVSVTPFDQARAQLLGQQAPQIFDTWLRGRLRTAAVTVNPRYGRFDRSTGEVVPVRSTGTETGQPSPSATSAVATATPTPTP